MILLSLDGVAVRTVVKGGIEDGATVMIVVEVFVGAVLLGYGITGVVAREVLLSKMLPGRQ